MNSFIHTIRSTQTTTTVFSALPHSSHTDTHTDIRTESVSEVLLWEDALLCERRVCVGTKKRGKDRERENEGWQRRGVTETITVIPHVAAWRYALHHSSFICSLAPLFCVSLSVCGVASLCLSCLLCLSLQRLLTCIICFSWVLHVWVSLQRVSCSLCCQSGWLICALVTHSSVSFKQSDVHSTMQPINYSAFHMVKQHSYSIIYFTTPIPLFDHLINQ